MNRKHLIVSAVTVLALIVLGGLGWLIEARVRGSGPLAIGDPAVAFTVTSLDSRPLRLGDYRKKVVVLNFWATWCPPCVEETPSLEKFAERVRGGDVEVIGVSVDQDSEALRNFVAKYHLSYPIGRDPGRALAARYGTVQFPETYILDRAGNLADKIVGGADWSDPRILSYVEDLAHPGQAK